MPNSNKKNVHENQSKRFCFSRFQLATTEFSQDTCFSSGLNQFQIPVCLFPHTAFCSWIFNHKYPNHIQGLLLLINKKYRLFSILDDDGKAYFRRKACFGVCDYFFVLYFEGRKMKINRQKRPQRTDFTIYFNNVCYGSYYTVRSQFVLSENL